METGLIERISHVQNAYVHCLDEGKYEEWPQFFLDDCHYRITTARNVRQGLEAGIIWADSRGMLVDRISSLREANIYETHRYRHILGQSLIGEVANDEVTCETSFIVVRITQDGPMDLFATGRYLDRFKSVSDTFKIKERIVVCDSSFIDTLLAIPL